MVFFKNGFQIFRFAVKFSFFCKVIMLFSLSLFKTLNFLTIIANFLCQKIEWSIINVRKEQCDVVCPLLKDNVRFYCWKYGRKESGILCQPAGYNPNKPEYYPGPSLFSI